MCSLMKHMASLVPDKSWSGYLQISMTNTSFEVQWYSNNVLRQIGMAELFSIG